MNILIQFEKKPIIFQKPISLITTRNPSVLEACFIEMERALESGYYLAGFLSYEAGYAFEERLWQDKQYDFPLVYFGVYGAPVNDPPPFFASGKTAPLKNLRLNILQEKYFDEISTIRSHIAKGDVYQVTYCIKLLFDFLGAPRDLYTILLKDHPVPYPAYIETDEFHILSFSPEQFMRKQIEHIITKPMKGTWPRGEGVISDFTERNRFASDQKNRAENLMIADLLRNDLGRVGYGVRVPRLFEVTGYKTLYQMTSTVTASLPKGILLYRLFKAIFPSGSVTGAPKIRAMEIIRELESEERRIYTGAIGYITPHKDLFFNVPIRTLLIRDGHGEMGLGGGIVWDSTAQGEWEEGLLKARFITDLYGAL